MSATRILPAGTGRLLGCLWGLLGLAAVTARAQQRPIVAHEPARSSLVVDLLIGGSPPEEMTLLDEAVTGVALSAALGVGYELPLWGCIDLTPRFESLVVSRRGQIGSDAYRSRSVRFGGGGQLGVRPAPGWRVAAGLNVRNERDIEDWDVRRIRNVRYAARLTASADFAPRWRATVLFERTLGSGGDSRFLSDPRRRILAGLTYRLRAVAS